MQMDIFSRPRPKLPQTERILKALRESKSGITSRDMVNMGIFRYSARLAELRQAGYNIVAVREKGTLFRYYLKDTDDKWNLSGAQPPEGN
jgi:hypothetical protein